MLKDLLKSAQYFLDGINYEISLLSNASAYLNTYLENCNWVGFYLVEDDKLILGPFQGKPACLEIPFNRGICGACATTLEIQRVDDVHKVPSHIACDSASNSEIVLPIILEGKLYGLLDIDSILFENFSKEDEEILAQFVDILTNILLKIRTKQI